MDKAPLRHASGVEQPSNSTDYIAYPTTVDAMNEYTHENADPTMPPEAEKPPVSIRNIVKELLETAIYIFLVFVIVRSMVQNFKIEGLSMEPSLHSEQYILVNKLVYFHFDRNAPMRLLPGNEDLAEHTVYPFSMPERGDIVVFEYPNDITKDYIKRVVGLPGETIDIRDGHVYVDGVLLEEPYLEGGTTYCGSGRACSNGPVFVPEGTVFVLGDNRSNSSDSREWGPLALEHVIGQAWILYFPLDQIGIVPHETYAVDEAP